MRWKVRTPTEFLRDCELTDGKQARKLAAIHTLHCRGSPIVKMTILSHARLAIESSGRQLICYPWLIGSCYWRSWWNYPPVEPKLIASLRPDWIYLTHIHWDHFHGASLKLFSRDTPILIPFD